MLHLRCVDLQDCPVKALTIRAAIDQSFDVRVGLVAQLLVVGSLQVQRSVVVVLGASVGPGH